MDELIRPPPQPHRHITQFGSPSQASTPAAFKLVRPTTFASSVQQGAASSLRRSPARVGVYNVGVDAQRPGCASRQPLGPYLWRHSLLSSTLAPLHHDVIRSALHARSTTLIEGAIAAMIAACLVRFAALVGVHGAAAGVVAAVSAAGLVTSILRPACCGMPRTSSAVSVTSGRHEPILRLQPRELLDAANAGALASPVPRLSLAVLPRELRGARGSVRAATGAVAAAVPGALAHVLQAPVDAPLGMLGSISSPSPRSVDVGTLLSSTVLSESPRATEARELTKPRVSAAGSGMGPAASGTPPSATSPRGRDATHAIRRNALGTCFPSQGRL